MPDYEVLTQRIIYNTKRKNAKVNTGYLTIPRNICYSRLTECTTDTVKVLESVVRWPCTTLFAEHV